MNTHKKIVLHIVTCAIMGGVIPFSYAMNAEQAQERERRVRQSYVSFEDEFNLPYIKKIALKDTKFLNSERLSTLAGAMVTATILGGAVVNIAVNLRRFQTNSALSFSQKVLAGMSVASLLVAYIRRPEISQFCREIRVATRDNAINDNKNMRPLLNPRGVRTWGEVDVDSTLMESVADNAVLQAQFDLWGGLAPLTQACIANGANINATAERSWPLPASSYLTLFPSAFSHTRSVLHEAIWKSNLHNMEYLLGVAVSDVQQIQYLLAAGVDVTKELADLNEIDEHISELEYIHFPGDPNERQITRLRRQLWDKLMTVKPLLEHPEKIFAQMRKPERHMYREMLRKRCAVTNPSLQEAVNQYERVGFKPSLAKWCRNNTCKMLTKLPLAVADKVFLYTEAEDEDKKLLTKALDIAFKRNDKDLIEVLRKCGALYSEDVKYTTLYDEFKAYNAGNTKPVVAPDIAHTQATTQGN